MGKRVWFRAFNVVFLPFLGVVLGGVVSVLVMLFGVGFVVARSGLD